MSIFKSNTTPSADAQNIANMIVACKNSQDKDEKQAIMLQLWALNFNASYDKPNYIIKSCTPIAQFNAYRITDNSAITFNPGQSLDLAFADDLPNNGAYTNVNDNIYYFDPVNITCNETDNSQDALLAEIKALFASGTVPGDTSNIDLGWQYKLKKYATPENIAISLVVLMGISLIIKAFKK